MVMNNQMRFNVTMHCKIIIILYKGCYAEMAYIFDKVNLVGWLVGCV